MAATATPTAEIAAATLVDTYDDALTIKNQLLLGTLRLTDSPQGITSQQSGELLVLGLFLTKGEAWPGGYNLTSRLSRSILSIVIKGVAAKEEKHRFRWAATAGGHAPECRDRDSFSRRPRY